MQLSCTSEFARILNLAQSLIFLCFYTVYRRCLIIEPTPLVDGWKSILNIEYKTFYGQPYRDKTDIILPVVHNKVNKLI